MYHQFKLIKHFVLSAVIIKCWAHPRTPILNMLIQEILSTHLLLSAFTFLHSSKFPLESRSS